jgi:hypothetical protein
VQVTVSWPSGMYRRYGKVTCAGDMAKCHVQVARPSDMAKLH